MDSILCGDAGGNKNNNCGSQPHSHPGGHVNCVV